MNEQIARIEKTFLGVEDHGILTAFLHVTYGGSGQGVGGYTLDGPVNGPDGRFSHREGSAWGMEWVRRALDACGVDSWERLVGRTIMVYKESESWGARVLGIGPLPTEKGKPFMFADLTVEEEAVR